MIKELLYKWFGLEPTPCATCEVLHLQLAESNRERRELLHKLLEKDKSEPPSNTSDPPVPIMPTFAPWRVRQQMLEAEDRKKAQLLKQYEENIKVPVSNPRIDELEKELGVATGE